MWVHKQNIPPHQISPTSTISRRLSGLEQVTSHDATIPKQKPKLPIITSMATKQRLRKVLLLTERAKNKLHRR